MADVKAHKTLRVEHNGVPDDSAYCLSMPCDAHREPWRASPTGPLGPPQPLGALSCPPLVTEGVLGAVATPTILTARTRMKACPGPRPRCTLHEHPSGVAVSHWNPWLIRGRRSGRALAQNCSRNMRPPSSFVLVLSWPVPLQRPPSSVVRALSMSFARGGGGLAGSMGGGGPGGGYRVYGYTCTWESVE